MTLSTSAVAVCCCSDSRSSLSSRAFSMAMTAYGKILNQVDLLVGERPDLLTVNEVASGRRRDELARDAAHQQHGKAKARRLREARLARAIPSARRN